MILFFSFIIVYLGLIFLESSNVTMQIYAWLASEDSYNWGTYGNKFSRVPDFNLLNYLIFLSIEFISLFYISYFIRQKNFVFTFLKKNNILLNSIFLLLLLKIFVIFLLNLFTINTSFINTLSLIVFIDMVYLSLYVIMKIISEVWR